MREIWLVRHSQRDTTIQEDQAAPLTLAGQARLPELTAYFQDKAPAAVYSSPYQRAMLTAEAIAAPMGLPVHCVAALRERSIGEWVADFESFARHQWTDPDFRLPQGESLWEVSQRMTKAFAEILTQTSGNLVITGHGTAFAVLLTQLTKGGFGFEDFQKMSEPDVYQLQPSADGDLWRCQRIDHFSFS